MDCSRDLKPENILMKSEGDNSDLVLADFGFVIQCCGSDQTQQCGSPLYIAPEIIQNQNYGVGVDMWSVGVLVFILLGGYPPFNEEPGSDLYQNICKGDFSFDQKWWDCVSEDAKDLVRKLLQVDPLKRLTARQAMRHPWFLTDESSLMANNLEKTLVKLRVWNAKTKLKAAVKAVLATKKIKNICKRKLQKQKSEPPMQVIKEVSSFSEKDASSFSEDPKEKRILLPG
jgi:calcium/calmodulin-dependent protein kinase (CaM kinase) II/calcium/calmodulin-dependent protein kinase I